MATVATIVGCVVVAATLATTAPPWTASVYAQPTRLTEGVFPQWSPTGDEIAFTRLTTDTAGTPAIDVWLMDPQGQQQQNLTAGIAALASTTGFRGQAAWHPSGHYLVFTAETTAYPRKGTGTTARPGIGRNHNVWVMTRDGSQVWQLTDYPENWGVLRPSFSHDGTMVMWNEQFSMEKYPQGTPDDPIPHPGHYWGPEDFQYRRGEELGAWRVVLADVSFATGAPVLSHLRTINPPPNFTLLEASGFSQNDQTIYYSYTDLTLTRDGRATRGDIYTTDLSGHGLQRLTFALDIHDENAVESPDESLVALARSIGGLGQPGEEDLFLMAPNGTALHQRTFFTQPGAPEYDPDARQLSEISWHPEGHTLAIGHASRPLPGGLDWGSSVWTVPAQPPGLAMPPLPPTSGPGSATYSHAEVVPSQHGQGATGYWLYEPASPTPASAPLIVLLHGHGGTNPQDLGGWIEHLVRRGHLVIFPAYQAGPLTLPRTYVRNALIALRAALAELATGAHVRPHLAHVAFLGYSGGGYLAANLAAAAPREGLPMPTAVLAVHPGIQGLIPLDDLSTIPPDTLLLVLAGEDDRVATIEDAQALLQSTPQIPATHKALLLVPSDAYGWPPLLADHLAPGALDVAYDDGTGDGLREDVRIRLGTDGMDTWVYWRRFDALLDAAFGGGDHTAALGQTPSSRARGAWSDGVPVAPLQPLSE